MNPYLILSVYLLFLSGFCHAQIGMSAEEGVGLPNRISIRKINEYGKEFIRIATKDEKGLVLEMDFLDDKCVWARWVILEGGLPTNFKEDTWKKNFKNEKIVQKDGERWKGEKGNKMSWGKTTSGKEVVVVSSKEMDEVLKAEAIRRLEKKYGKPIDAEALKKKDNGLRVTFGERDDGGVRQVYNENSEWVGTIRNGQVYGTDSSWKGSVRNGQIYGTDSTWRGSINDNGQIYNTDSEWKGNAR